MPTWEEQRLCIGASFYLAATNVGQSGASRWIKFSGFCQSIDHLMDTVGQAVEERLGGEVLWEERQLKR